VENKKNYPNCSTIREKFI